MASSGSVLAGVPEIDDEVVVVWAIAVGRERVEAAARVALHAGVKREQVLEVATLERQFVDRFVGEDAAEDGVARFGQRSFVFDFDNLGNRADPHVEVDLEIIADLDLHAFADDFGEAGRFDSHRIKSGIDAWRGIIARRVGLKPAAHVRREIFDIDRRVGHRGACRIGDLAADAALRGLCECAWRGEC
jgi:hypothetical protein